MGTFYLVDYENVGSGGLAKCSGLDKTDQLHIFYTENSKNINLDIVDNHGEAVLETHKVPTGSQSADMHIVSYMGYLLGKHENSQIKIVIVSKDKDYDNLIKFWSGKVDISRKQKIDVSAAKKEQLAKKAPESKTQPQNTKKTSNTTTNTNPNAAVNNPTKSELKKQLNVEVQRALSQAGYSQVDIGHIAKLVCKHFGEENYKQKIYNDLRIEIGEYTYQEAYNCLKPILKKYGK
jgi:hypothetical protein